MTDPAPRFTPSQIALAATPITPFPQGDWKVLSGKGQWDVISAMRGPDFQSGSSHYAVNLLKWLTTSVLRSRMRECFRVGGLTNPHSSIILLPASTVWKDSRFNADHFIGHIRDAAAYVNIPIARIPAKDYIGIIDGQPVGYAILNEFYGSHAQALINHIAWTIGVSASYWAPKETPA